MIPKTQKFSKIQKKGKISWSNPLHSSPDCQLNTDVLLSIFGGKEQRLSRN